MEVLFRENGGRMKERALAQTSVILSAAKDPTVFCGG